VTEIVSIERDGAGAARVALERTVRAGGIALFPADTLYGLACDPLDAAAIRRIDELKGRAADKPAAVMFFSPLAMRELVATLDPRTRDALGALLPGPVTLVIANPERRYPLACREDPERLGVRLIDGPLAGAAVAVYQTSANPSGKAAASRFDAIDERLVAAADLAIDGGGLGGEPSSVVDLTAIEDPGAWKVLREGAMSRAEIEARLARACCRFG
jgi:L-threonylcarbamoyladenylate synthase